MKMIFTVACLLAVAPARADSVKLGVVVVVDQMRADYLERDPQFTGGFKRLAQEGAVFTDAHHRHIPTETGPGHAAISTGRAPATHGIVANDWFDRATGSSTYCVADRKNGIGPEHLDGPTLADSFKAANSNARVFAVAGKDRAAVLLGGRHPNIVLWLDRSKGVFTTASYGKKPKWLDKFNAELADSALLPLRKGSVSGETLASPAYDEATARLILELMRQENVGRGPGKDLLLVSFSATDYVGHRYGTEAPEMVAQLRALDGIIGRLMTKWKDVSGGSLALAFSADHGAIPAPEDPAGKAMGVQRIDWDSFEQGMERALEEKWSASGDKWIVADDIPHLYLNRALAGKKHIDWMTLQRESAKIIAGLFGVERVIVSTDIPTLDPSDSLAAVLKRSYRADRSGDLYVIMGENVLLHDQPTGTSHGTPWPYDTHVPLVFWGRGIKKGRYEAPASPMDIAPTLARHLGFVYAPGDGGAVRREVPAEYH